MTRRSKTKQIALSIFVVLFCMAIWGSVAAGHEATITWTLPTHTVSGGDCLTDGYPIPPTTPIVSLVRWREQGATTWNMSITGPGVTTFTIPDLVPATAYEVQVGSNYEGVTTPPLCFTDSTLFTTPGYEPPRPCSNVTVTGVQ